MKMISSLLPPEMAITRRKGVKGSFFTSFCDKMTTMRILPMRPNMVTMMKLIIIAWCTSIISDDLVDDTFQSLVDETFQDDAEVDDAVDNAFDDAIQSMVDETSHGDAVDDPFQSMVEGKGEGLIDDDIVEVYRLTLVKVNVDGGSTVVTHPINVFSCEYATL